MGLSPFALHSSRKTRQLAATSGRRSSMFLLLYRGNHRLCLRRRRRFGAAASFYAPELPDVPKSSRVPLQRLKKERKKSQHQEIRPVSRQQRMQRFAPGGIRTARWTARPQRHSVRRQAPGGRETKSASPQQSSIRSPNPHPCRGQSTTRSPGRKSSQQSRSEQRL